MTSLFFHHCLLPSPLLSFNSQRIVTFDLYNLWLYCWLWRFNKAVYCKYTDGIPTIFLTQVAILTGLTINSLLLRPAVCFLFVQHFEPAFDDGEKHYIDHLYYYCYLFDLLTPFTWWATIVTLLAEQNGPQMWLCSNDPIIVNWIFLYYCCYQSESR